MAEASSRRTQRISSARAFRCCLCCAFHRFHIDDTDRCNHVAAACSGIAVILSCLDHVTKAFATALCRHAVPASNAAAAFATSWDRSYTGVFVVVISESRDSKRMELCTGLRGLEGIDERCASVGLVLEGEAAACKEGRGDSAGDASNGGLPVLIVRSIM